jgi:hypothetical protein
MCSRGSTYIRARLERDSQDEARAYNRRMAKRKAGKRAGPSAQEIANIAGVSLTLVNRKLAQGKSPKQIIAEAVEREQAVGRDILGLPVVPINGHAAGIPPFAASQAAKEFHLSRIRQYEADAKAGELMPVSYARFWGLRFLIEGRDILMNGPSELQDSLAAEADPLKVHAILKAWVERIMERFYRLERLWSPPPAPPGMSV